MTTPPKGWAGFGALKEASRQRQDRDRTDGDEETGSAAPDITMAPRATVAHETTVAGSATVAQDATVAHDATANFPEKAQKETMAQRATVAPRTIAQDATVARYHGEPWHGATVAQDATVAPLTTVQPVAGFFSIPNTVTDSLWQVLDAYQAKVYIRLLRLTRGYRRDTCRVGYDRLAATCKLSKRKVQDVVAQLQAMGLVERLEVSYGERGQDEKGTLYRVIVPGETIAPDATVARGATVARDATVAPDATNKYILKKHDKKAGEDSIYEIRTIAARIFEARRNEPGFDKDRLREAVRDVMIGEGRDVVEETIEEAIKAMTM